MYFLGIYNFDTFDRAYFHDGASLTLNGSEFYLSHEKFLPVWASSKPVYFIVEELGGLDPFLTDLSQVLDDFVPLLIEEEDLLVAQ